MVGGVGEVVGMHVEWSDEAAVAVATSFCMQYGRPCYKRVPPVSEDYGFSLFFGPEDAVFVPLLAL